jgi:hypothetical protein
MLLRALGDSGTIAGRLRLPGAKAGTLAAGLAALALTSVVSGCGGGESQDADEPSGSYQVEVSKASFPERQRLADTLDLQLQIRNADDQTVPNLAVTIWTGDTKAGVTATGSGQGSFNVPVDQPGLANPNRPVWILEHRYPKLLTSPEEAKHLDRAPSAGAAAAQTDTFQFGPLRAGERKDILWRVTAVRVGTYTIHYEVAAGLQGKAKAVTSQGRPVKGQFVATISRKPPPSCVNDAGNVTHKCSSS